MPNQFQVSLQNDPLLERHWTVTLGDTGPPQRGGSHTSCAALIPGAEKAGVKLPIRDDIYQPIYMVIYGFQLVLPLVPAKYQSIRKNVGACSMILKQQSWTYPTFRQTHLDVARIG